MGKNKGFQATSEEIDSAFQSNANGSYNGIGDPSIDFANQNSFANEPSSKRQFKMTLKNTMDEDKTIALAPGYHSSASDILDANGVAVDAILAEGTLLTEGTGSDQTVVTAKGNPKSIDLFVAAFKQNPTRIVSISLNASDSSVLGQPIYHKSLSPYAGGSEFRMITPSDYVDEHTQQPNRATCDVQSEDLQFDSSTVVLYTIPAGEEVEITMYIGAILNTSLELRRKAKYGRMSAINS